MRPPPPPPVCSKTTGPDPVSSSTGARPPGSRTAPQLPSHDGLNHLTGRVKADAVFTVRTYGTRQLCDPGLARVQLWRPENVQLTAPSLHRTQEREPTQDNDA